MLEYFEICPGDDNDNSLFPAHVTTRDVVDGVVVDPIGGRIQPIPIDYTYWKDRRLLEEILPHRQPHEREADHISSLINFQLHLNTFASEYTRELRRTDAPPPDYDSGFILELFGESDKEEGQPSAVRTKPVLRDDSDTASTVQFEWDSDSSHHFTGTKKFFLPGSFVVQKIKVYITDGQWCYAEGYGSFGHRMLNKVWYVPKFKGRPNLFSDVIAMSDGFSCQRISHTLEYLEDGIVIKTGQLKSNRWILTFELTDHHQSDRSIDSGHANGTGMGILPIPVQTVLMHRRCNHVGPYVLYIAVSKGLTSGMCAGKSAASFANINSLDCPACSLSKSHYADHIRRHPELLRQGRERQRLPGHLTPRGVHGGISRYEFIALDLKTDLPKTRNGCTICMIIVCLYSMRRHLVALLRMNTTH